ncbi:MAG: CBS domain-containing protein [Pirellulales bacterium]
MTVERICQRHVDVAVAEESVFVAAERMHQRTVGALVIVDDANVPIGILTDRDLVTRSIAAGRDAYTTAIRDVMTPRPKTVLLETPIAQALSLMRDGAFRRLLIVNGDGQLAGIVTLDDILLFLSEQFGSVGKLLARETPQAAAEPVKHSR